MKNYLSNMAKTISPYQWEEGIKKEWLRFDANTLPFPPKSVESFLLEMKNSCSINEYADPAYKKLKGLIADYEKVSTEMITVTNSGDEAIDIIAKAFLNPKDYFVTTPPTYEMFSIQCKINNGRELQIPLQDETWEINAKEIVKISNKQKVKIIFLVNPNNPTGSTISQKTIEYVLANANCIVIIDEAYREFYGKSAVQLIKKYDNLVILRSLSKFAGLAGARIGYLIASEKLSQIFDGIRFPMGVSFLSYKLAEVVLENDAQWMQNQIETIKKERKKLTEAITKLGFKVYPSQANFLLVNFGDFAASICLQLREKGIVIRDRSKKKYLSGCVRITIRSSKENSALLAALKEIVKPKQKYAFIDRDGTLIFEPQDTFQVDSVEKLKLLRGVIEGLKILVRKGFMLVMVTNQDGLGTQSFPQANFDEPQNKMLSIFKKEGVLFAKIFVCPQLPTENCDCRKPKIGLVKNLIINMNKKQSFVCGDRVTDKLFAKNLGITYIPMKTNGNFLNALKQGGIV